MRILCHFKRRNIKGLLRRALEREWGGLNMARRIDLGTSAEMLKPQKVAIRY